MNSLHINCDMAESYGNFKFGNDDAIIPYVDAVNIACGFHGGDPMTIIDTIKHALILQKQIGAHPSYPDLVGFGRRYMDMTKAELYASLLYQICAVKAITESLGGVLTHVKPHGALYISAFSNIDVASVIVAVVKSVDANLHIYTQENGVLSKIAASSGLIVKHEGFADRKYNVDGTLVSRTISGAVIEDANDIKKQAELLQRGKAMTIAGDEISVKADTICLHGDHPNIKKALLLIRGSL